MKNIIFCADGTWNGPTETDPNGLATPSNVQKLFENLAGQLTTPIGAEMERSSPPTSSSSIEQVAKYIHGVGDTSNVLARHIEGDFGIGLLPRLIRGYTFLSRNYEPGDAIYLVGFSRGAYTVRALAGLIAAKGLLNWTALGFNPSGSDEGAYAAASKAWTDYRRQTCLTAIGNDLDTLIHEATGAFGAMFSNPPEPIYHSDISIKAIGVWDTVGAMGVPVDLPWQNQRIDLYQFDNTDLSPKVEFGFQAISIDEQREDFSPTLWQPREGVKQVLFPGAHADVGGGYAPDESGLSNGALRWMADRLSGVGLQFGPNPWPIENSKGMAHRPWLDSLTIRQSRTFRPGLELSSACVERVVSGDVPVQPDQAGSAPLMSKYRPENLAASYFKPDWSSPREGVHQA